MDTKSEEWRHKCECTLIARLMWRGAESSLLEKIAKARGKEVADRLRFEAMDIVKEHRK